MSPTCSLGLQKLNGIWNLSLTSTLSLLPLYWWSTSNILSFTVEMDHFIRNIAGVLSSSVCSVWMYNDFNFVHWIYGMQEFNTFLHFYSGEYRAIYKQENVHIVEYRILLPDILLSKWWYLNLTSQILIVLLNTKKWDLDHLDWDQYLYFKIIYNILCMQWRGWSGVKWCREIIFVLVPAPAYL